MEEQLPRSDGAGLRIRPHVSNSVEMCGDVWTAWWLFNAEQPPWRDGSGRSVEWLKEVWNVWTIGGNGMGTLRSCTKLLPVKCGRAVQTVLGL